MAIGSLPFLFIAKLFHFNQEQNLKIIHVICKMINFCSGNHIHVEGFYNLKNSNDFMLFANHLSFFDILSLMSFIPKQIIFVAKESLAKIPIANWWFNTQDTIYLDRGNMKSGMQVIKEVIKKMNQGYNIGVFPAGTRSNEQLAFKPQFIQLAYKHKKTVIPLTIKNTNLLLEDRTNNKSVDTYFIFHQPIKYEDYQDLSIDEFVQKVENIIYERRENV